MPSLVDTRPLDSMRVICARSRKWVFAPIKAELRSMCTPRRRFVNSRLRWCMGQVDAMILYDCQRTGHKLNPPVFLRAVDGKGLFGGVDVVVDAGCSGTLSTIF
jgi:hypothetical protein